MVHPLFGILKLPFEEVAVLDLGRFFPFSGGTLAHDGRRLVH
jgi:hypothetical protein